MAISLFQKQILATVAYSAQFNFPLTAEEIWVRLMKVKGQNKSDKSSLNTELFDLVKKKILIKEGIYFYPHFVEIDLVSLRYERGVSSQQILEESLEVVKLVKLVKENSYIRGLAVTGSVAVGNASDDEDLDIMVITAPGTLWLVRIWLLWQRWRLGKRKGAHNWCLNVWLEQDSLEIEPKKRSIYMAYEVVQAKWIYDLEYIENKWLAENAWIKEFLPNLFISEKVDQNSTKQTKMSLIFRLLNLVCYYIQIWYLRIKLRIPEENLKKEQAFLHRNESQDKILSNFLLFWTRMLKI